jgi:hypothetical protein
MRFEEVDCEVVVPSVILSSLFVLICCCAIHSRNRRLARPLETHADVNEVWVLVDSTHQQCTVKNGDRDIAVSIDAFFPNILKGSGAVESVRNKRTVVVQDIVSDPNVLLQEPLI